MKKNNTDPLDTGTSWVGDTAPTAADVAVWNNTLPAANTSSLNVPVTWDGIRVTNPGGPVTVTGDALLTLDGGATTDINLSAATQNLTLETPVAMLGTLTTTVAAGRTLTFAGPLSTTATTWGRTGTGTVIFDNEITSAAVTTLELQEGTNIFTGRNGGLSLTSTAAGARIFVGRNNRTATLIISNGFHEARGVNSAVNANLIGATGSTGHLFIVDGTLRVPYLRAGINDNATGHITVNGGTLEATAGSATANLDGYALMLANVASDNGAVANANASLTVNGGQALFTNGIVKLGSPNGTSSGSAAITLNGGTLATRRIYADISHTKTFTFNGGTLRATGGGALFDGPGASNGSLALNVGNGGARIDTGANTLTLATPLRAAGTGGLDKLGSGTLTLAAANTYTGKTRVLGGTLAVSAAAAASAANLTLVSGTGLSLADGTLSTFAPTALALPSAAPITLTLETAPGNSASDCLVLPAGTVLGAMTIAPVIQGTAARTARIGDYTVLAYSGAAPDISGLSVPAPALILACSIPLTPKR
ncbi:MAG: autotransporter-associated beta strand repeat-containing protein, partial [Verrucomicrobiota bacterium]|nr:autotransporter-associated beta strand repeat-containing protein [Verrucomicrobiota bacterium]